MALRASSQLKLNNGMFMCIGILVASNENV